MAAQISVKIKPQETTQTASKTLGPEELRPEQRKADRQVEHIYIYMCIVFDAANEWV